MRLFFYDLNKIPFCLSLYWKLTLMFAFSSSPFISECSVFPASNINLLSFFFFAIVIRGGADSTLLANFP